MEQYHTKKVEKWFLTRPCHTSQPVGTCPTPPAASLPYCNQPTKHSAFLNNSLAEMVNNKLYKVIKLQHFDSFSIISHFDTSLLTFQQPLPCFSFIFVFTDFRFSFNFPLIFLFSFGFPQPFSLI